MKKILCIVLLCVCMVLNCSAIDISIEDTNSNTTVIFSSDTAFTDAEMERIANILIYGNPESNISTYSLCWLTGHNLTSEGVTTIEHKVSATAPRCYKTFYNVETCSKCDYVNTTVVSQMFINCCPED